MSGASRFTTPPIARPTDGLAKRLGLLDVKDNLLAGSMPRPGHARTALKDDLGRTIGYLVMNPPEDLERAVDRAFLEKQIGFVAWTGAAGLLLALGLVGMGTPLLAAAGSLLLLVQLLVVGSYAIQSSVMLERKEQTQPFVMSLPVTPMDVYWGKLLANLVIYLVPFLLVSGGLLALVLTTPRPDGAVPWVIVVALFMLAQFCLSLCMVIAVDSEGWNVFAMLALMTLIGPFL